MPLARDALTPQNSTSSREASSQVSGLDSDPEGDVSLIERKRKKTENLVPLNGFGPWFL